MDPKLLMPVNPLDLRVASLSRKSRNRMRLDRLARANAVQPVIYQANLGAADNGRLPSRSIWYDCPWDQLVERSIGGMQFEDDFDTPGFTTPTTSGAYGAYYQGFSSTGGTLTPATAVRYGTIVLGSDGDNEGSSLQTTGTPYQVNVGEGQFWFEARVKVNTIAVTMFDAFIGMVEPVTLTAVVPVTATAGAVSDNNMFGFLRPGTSTAGDGSLLRTFYKANGVTAVTVADYAAMFVADTYIKLGMRYSPADNLLRFFANNLQLATTKLIPSAAGTDFPNDVVVAPTAGVTNAAANSPNSAFTIDWWRVAQMDAGIYPGA